MPKPRTTPLPVSLPRFGRTLLTLLVGAVVVTGVGACGSAVAFEQEATVVVARSGGSSGQSIDSAPAQQDFYEDELPEEPHAYGEEEPSTVVPGPADADDPHAPDEDSPEKPAAPPVRPEASECDWQVNLERAKVDHPAEWIVLDTGAWGRAEVPGERIWIAPRTPCDKVYSVAVHEWTHHMQGVVYRDWGEVLRELAPYGGPEVVADCGALLLGATWIRYGCAAERSFAAAAAILRGERPRAEP